MSKLARYITATALFGAAFSVAAHARGPGTHVNDAKYYGPVYGWRYYPPPAAAASDPTCAWTVVHVMRNGQPITRRVRRCT